MTIEVRPIPMTVDLLVGEWAVDRFVVDDHRHQEVTFTGVAHITPGPDRWRYSETGESRCGNRTMPATRRYWLRPSGSSRLEMTFSTDEPFHTIDPGGPTWSDTHECGNDTYRVFYEFHHANWWRSTWRVVGPTKRYVSVTDYSRATTTTPLDIIEHVYYGTDHAVAGFER